jgi:hypothetical protein
LSHGDAVFPRAFVTARAVAELKKGNDLVRDMKCIPCMVVNRLTEQQILELMPQVADWTVGTLKVQRLERIFKFRNFSDAVESKMQKSHCWGGSSPAARGWEGDRSMVDSQDQGLHSKFHHGIQDGRSPARCRAAVH